MATADMTPETLQYPAIPRNTSREEAALRIQQSASILVDSAWQTAEQTHKYHDEQLRWFCTHPAAPEHFLLKLCDQGRFLDELGHRTGPRSLLLKLAEEHQYPEAILTLAKLLYISPDETTASFVEFVTRHQDHDWMMTSLAYMETPCPDKERAFLEIVASHQDKENLERIDRLKRLALEARAVQRADRIERLYESREPHIWQALAGNPHTPPEILEKLAQAKDVKFARDIRDLAGRALRKRQAE